jgi:hypothetical protein
MIEKIIGATIVPDIQALGWADQIGWVVKPWTKRIETGEGQFTDIVYPVAEFVTTEDCDVTDYGLNILTTDKGYTSLILISLEGDMISETAPNIPQRRALNIEQDIKISVWLNNHQGSTHLAKAELMKALYRTIYRDVTIQWPYIGAADTDYDIFINKLKVTLVREIVTNPFNEYTFSKDQAQFHNNYSAFGFVFKLSGLIFPNCLPAYPTLDVDACETPTNADMPITSSGTYTPTKSAEANIASLNMSQAQYMRVGNTVTVSGHFTTLSSADFVIASFEIDLPVASNVGAIDDVSGMCSFLGGTVSMNQYDPLVGTIIGSVANNTAVINWFTGSNMDTYPGGALFTYTFTYQII